MPAALKILAGRPSSDRSGAGSRHPTGPGRPLFGRTGHRLLRHWPVDCRWSERTRNCQHDARRRLLNSDGRAGELQVGDRLRPLRVGTIRRASNRVVRWWVSRQAERHVPVLDLRSRDRVWVRRHRHRSRVAPRRLGLACWVGAGRDGVSPRGHTYYEVLVSKTSERGDGFGG
jgi:hypothetical protein